MAADSMLTLSPLPAPGPAASPAPAASAVLTPGPANPPLQTDSGSHSGSHSRAKADSPAPKPAQSAARGSSRTTRPGSGSSQSTGPRSTDSHSASSKSSAKDDSTQSAKATDDSRSGRRAARASAANSASSTTTTTSTPGTDDFSATLAKSLAATPSDGTAPADTASTKASANSDTDGSGGPIAKHAASDPVSTALALLENALAGALAGAIVGVPPAAAPTAVSASAGDSSLLSGVSGTGSSTDGSAGSLLQSLLTDSLTEDPKGSTAAPNGSTTTGAAPAPTAVATPAALAAAQLIAPPHVGSLQAGANASTLSSPVGTSAWTDELSAKVTWMAHQGIQSASLQLSPEHLGPVQVSISVHQGQASVWFGAAQADTRTALQQSLPQLRQLFASQGLSLTDTGVSREPPRGHSRQQSTRAPTPVAGIAAVHADGSAGRVSVAGLGLLDTYA